MLILGSRLTTSTAASAGSRPNGFTPALNPAKPRLKLNGASCFPSNGSNVLSEQPELDEIELLGRRCKEGDVAAWSLLFPKVWPVLVTFVHRLYHSFDQQDAEDVAQASIEAAIRSIGTFTARGLFRAWLFGIAVRQAAGFYRAISAKKRGTHLQVAYDDMPDHPADSKSPAEASAENDRAAILHRAIAELPELDRDLVHLHFFGELTFREIGETLRMNPKTVCTRLTRCKERLLVTLARFDLTESDG